MQLVLASTSPRRRELLALLRVPFEVSAPSFEEHPIPGLPPREQAARFALEKARSVADRRREDFILGSDTVIELDGQWLGKPVDSADARAMLARLAGRTHAVHTAVALCRQASALERVAIVTAVVTMKADDGSAIDRYVATGEPLGKAGAYSIQGLGGDLIARLEGDFTAVVGFPLRAVVDLLHATEYPVPCDVHDLYRTRPYPNWSRFYG